MEVPRQTHARTPCARRADKQQLGWSLTVCDPGDFCFESLADSRATVADVRLVPRPNLRHYGDSTAAPKGGFTAFTTLRAASTKSWAAGPRGRPFNVIIPTTDDGTGHATASTLR